MMKRIILWTAIVLYIAGCSWEVRWEPPIICDQPTCEDKR